MTAPAILDAVGDFDAAVRRLQDAADDDEQRRSLTEALAALYALRDLRRGDGPARTVYEGIAAGCPGGKTAEGLVVARNTRIHQLTHAVTPQPRGLFPGAQTYPGVTLTWLAAAEMAPAVAANLQRKKMYPDDDAAVAGQPVLATLRAARAFLVEPTPLGPL